MQLQKHLWSIFIGTLMWAPWGTKHLISPIVKLFFMQIWAPTTLSGKSLGCVVKKFGYVPGGPIFADFLG